MFHDVLCMHLFFGHSCTTLLIDSNRTQKDFQAVNESCLVKLPTCNWHAVSYIPHFSSFHMYNIIYNCIKSICWNAPKGWLRYDLYRLRSHAGKGFRYDLGVTLFDFCICMSISAFVWMGRPSLSSVVAGEIHERSVTEMQPTACPGTLFAKGLGPGQWSQLSDVCFIFCFHGWSQVLTYFQSILCWGVLPRLTRSSMMIISAAS